MKKLEIVKAGAALVVSVGVGLIVGNLIKNTTPADVRKLNKILIGIGSLVLTGIASDMAAKYTEGKIDDVADAVKGAFNENQELNEAVEGET